MYEVNYLQAGVALLLDTGLIGCLILFLLIYKNLILHLNLRYNFLSKLFLISQIIICVLSLFIGYPLVNIAFILFLQPDGITNTALK